MSQLLALKAEGVDLAASARGAAPKDAQLAACFLFLVAWAQHGEDGKMVQETFVAQAFGVTDWTVHRWLLALAEKGYAAVAKAGQGVLQVDLRLPITASQIKKIGPWNEPGAETGPKMPQDEKNAQDEQVPILAGNDAPASTAEAGQAEKAPITSGRSLSQEIKLLYQAEGHYPAILASKSREQYAWNTFLASGLAGRGFHEPVKKLLGELAQSPLFDQVDLPREILDADAWLAAHPKKRYTDMARFLGQWLRRSVSRIKKPLRNVNTAPTAGKYDAVEAKAKGL